MQRVSVHIPEEIKRSIYLVARAKSKAEAQVIREALVEGLRVIHPKSASAQALLDFAKLAEKIPSPPNTPRDVSVNHDYYAWGGKKRSDE